MPRKWKIGAVVNSLKMDVRAGLKQLKQMGADGFQVYVTHGEMYPDELTGARRVEFKKYVDDLGLEISALCGDFNWVKGFTDAEFNKVNIPRVKKCIDLACDLGTNIVTMHIGKLPENENDPVYQEAFRTAAELGAYAESRGCVLCSETGPEEPAKLLKFLQKMPTKGIGVNYDPANLIMAGPFSHLGGVHVLKNYIHHVHAKDGVHLGELGGREVPLGMGSVSFPYWLSALDSIGYKGFLTIEREGGSDPAGDVAMAIRFLDDVQSKPLPKLERKK